MDEVNVSAIIYNNGTQVFSKDLRPVSKPVNGTFTVVDASNLTIVNISCGGVEAAFNVELIANTYAVVVRVGLVFCPSRVMRVAVLATFSIPGERYHYCDFTKARRMSCNLCNTVLICSNLMRSLRR